MTGRSGRREIPRRKPAQASLGGFDALLEGEHLSVVELLLTLGRLLLVNAGLCLAEKLEGPVVLLVAEVVEPVAQQVPGLFA